MGGWSRVDMADDLSVRTEGKGYLERIVPFCPDSSTAVAQLLDEVSREPPTECMELAVEPRLAVWFG